MTYTIKAGKHRAWPPKIGLWLNKSVIEHDVFFHVDCKYFFSDEDQLDTNKLFGLGYFWNHHVDSARFGWRYNQDTNKIVLVAYCYVSNQRVIEDICEVPLMQWVRVRLEVFSYQYQFTVKNFYQTNVAHHHKKKWAFPLGVFFGGNKTAPHNMHIELK